MMDKFIEVSHHRQFLSEVADHNLVVKQDDGLYKHLLLHKPGSFEYAFEVISFPSHIMITGDMGTYCFSRVSDMFRWFIKDGDKSMDSPEMEMSRWFNKLVSVDSQLGAKKKNLGLALRHIEENRDFYLKEYPEHKDDIQEAFGELVGCAEMGVDALLTGMYDFEIVLCEEEHRPFSDFEHSTVEAYVSQFAWCCYAINYAIGEYLQSKTKIDKLKNE